MNRFCTPDVAPQFLHVAASILVLLVHRLPKAIHYTSQLDVRIPHTPAPTRKRSATRSSPLIRAGPFSRNG